MISRQYKFNILFALLLIPGVTYAEGLIRLTGLPGSLNTDLSTAGYINALYILSISVAAFLAVARIILAGLQYMLSDVVTDKSSARKQITGSILGLLIVIGAVLILETINPRLTDWSRIDNIPAYRDSISGGLNVNGSGNTSCASGDSDCLSNCPNPTAAPRSGRVVCGEPDPPNVTVTNSACKTIAPTARRGARSGAGSQTTYDCAEAETACTDGGGVATKKISVIECRTQGQDNTSENSGNNGADTGTSGSGVSGQRYSGSGEVKPGDIFIGYDPAFDDFPEGPNHNENIVFRDYWIGAESGLVVGIISEPNGVVIGCEGIRPQPPRCDESKRFLESQ